MRIRRAPIVVAALSLAFPFTAHAQLSLEDLDEGAIRHLMETRDLDGFGISRAETSAYSSRAFAPGHTDLWGHRLWDQGYRFLNGGPSPAWASMDLPIGTDIPLGAYVGAICAHVWDVLSTGEIRILLYQYEHPASPSGTPARWQLGATDGSGTTWSGGYTQICTLPLRQLRSFGDVDSNGQSGTVSYEVVLSFDEPTTSLSHGALTILWQRQLSPAPASATFSDVPTNHWAFRHIEALSESGITAGCGGSKFCPDSNLTRAEMAVFLAKGLGLHFEF